MEREMEMLPHSDNTRGPIRSVKAGSYQPPDRKYIPAVPLDPTGFQICMTRPSGPSLSEIHHR